MKSFWTLEPEVSGELGEKCIIDTSEHPPTVSKLHFLFNGWLGDELIECFPCFIISERISEELTSKGLTGFQIDTIEVSFSLEFKELFPRKKLPPFKWLKIIGTAGLDDFGLSSNNLLVVSDFSLRCLRRFPLNNCDIEKCS